MAPGLASQQAQHQAHGGAGIAAIEHGVGFQETIEAHALHPHRLSRRDLRHLHPHGPQAGRRTEGVLGGQEAFDHGFAFGDGAKEQGPVGDRFIPRNPNGSPETATTGKRQGIGAGGFVSQRGWPG